MSRLSLPILTLGVRQQRYSCHGCGNCCRDFTVQLRESDIAKLKEQGWQEKLGEPVTVEFRGTTFLRQREDGACIFLMDNGRCRIHKEHGFAEKPIACQLFPFHLTPAPGGIEMGINFACQSVLENKGAELRSHVNELSRMAGALAEVNVAANPPMLTDRLRASKREEQAMIRNLDAWLQRDDVDLQTRLDGMAWIVASLNQAKLENVREKRFEELLDVLFSAAPEELAHHPIDPPSKRQLKMLRQAVFARTEDPKLYAIERQGRFRTMLSQLSRSRRFKRGKGLAPRIGVGWPDSLQMTAVEQVTVSVPRGESNAMVNLGMDPIDDLLTRYLRASILGGRAWGAGYYGWNIVSGLQALLLNIACIGWLARLHAAGQQRDQIDIIDVRAAVGRIDRTAGRAKWLGSAAERLRLAYLSMDEGLRRLITSQRML